MNPRVFVIALLLAGCGERETVALSAGQKDYFGVWEYSGSEYSNNVDSDNMLLVFHTDSTVSYKRCINKIGSHRYVKLPGAPIRQFGAKQLTLSPGFWIFHWDTEFEIDRAPYVLGEETYVEIDGVKLRRLKRGEPSTHESWKCDSDDEDEKKK